MSRILAVVVLSALVFGGVGAIDLAYQQAEPETADDQQLQDDTLGVFASFFEIVEYLVLVVVVGLIVAAIAALRGGV